MHEGQERLKKPLLLKKMLYLQTIKKPTFMKTPEQIEKERKSKQFLKFGCLPISIIIIIAIIAGAINDDGKPKIPSESAAYVVSKAFAKTQVDFPEEAEFGVFPIVSEFDDFMDSTHRVIGEITVKNAFGMKSKGKYFIRMKHRGGDALNPHNWEVIDFSFQDFN